jgi:hypothetical protein
VKGPSETHKDSPTFALSLWGFGRRPLLTCTVVKEKCCQAGGSDLRMSRTKSQLAAEALLQYGTRDADWLSPTRPPSTPSAPVGKAWVRG